MTGLRYSEMDDESRKAMTASINRRWGKLSQLERESAAEGLKYLLFINSGASVALLAFLNAHPSAEKSLVTSYIALGFFVAGIILIGIFKIVAYFSVRRALHAYMNNSTAFLDDNITHEELNARNRRDARDSVWLMLLSVGAFGCFVIGAIAGIVSVLHFINP